MVEPSGNGNHHDAGLPSFWELCEYGRTVKRVEHARKLCSALDLMLRERAKIELGYSHNLKTWEGRWNNFWNSKLEYGSGASPWLGLCSEARALSDVHMDVCKALTEDIQSLLKNWQKDHYHKAKIPPYALKESRQLDKEFERAQKPWSKKIKKVHQCKHDYYDACRMERSLQVQVQNAKNDPSGTQEQLKKVEDKWKKAERDVEQTRSLYQSAIRDLEDETPRYLDEMARVFRLSQEAERERLCFFQDIATKFRDALNVTERTDTKAIFTKVDEAIAAVDVDGDLAWWSSHHGVDMPAVFPGFEEYSPEVAAITNKKRATMLDTNNAVTVTGITPIVSAPIPIQSKHENDVGEARPNGVQPKQERNPFEDDDDNEEVESRPADEQQPAPQQARPEEASESVATAVADGGQTQGRGATATGDDEETVPSAGGGGVDGNETDYCQSATYDDGRPGVKVRALYDYAGQEDDEITFKAGDIFEKLEEADSQGWCKGRKDGQAGLYPAKYAEEI